MMIEEGLRDIWAPRIQLYHDLMPDFLAKDDDVPVRIMTRVLETLESELQGAILVSTGTVRSRGYQLQAMVRDALEDLYEL